MRRTAWVGYAVALLATAVVTACVGALQGTLGVSNLSVLYLLAVLAVAVRFGRGPAIFLSLASFLAFNWFFVEPIHTFTVARLEEWAALLVFLAVAIITSQLAAAQRLRAQEAEDREREAGLLYDIVRLMGEPNLEDALQAVAERLRKALDLAAVGIELPDPAGESSWVYAGERGAVRALRSAANPARILGGGQQAGKSGAAAPGRWIRVVQPFSPDGQQEPSSELLHAVPVNAGERRLGFLLLLSRKDGPVLSQADDRLLSAVASQLALAIERRRLRREAMDAEVLRRGDELKTALLNAVSHDLRTPLSSIIASAGSLLQEDVAWSDKERKEFAQAIDDEARRLNRIVANLLNLSRINSGNLQPDKEWHDLDALVEDVLGRLQPLTSQHRVVVDIADDIPPVLLDYVEIDQVLSNLVENATKYSPPGGEIRVSARAEDGEVRVEVADQGPGVPEELKTRLFEPFSRAQVSARGRRGTGLGLAVARGLVEAHGGRIWFRNESSGGATFGFALPAPDRSEEIAEEEEK